MCKVSVIIPVYKVEKYIEKCARSLFEQSLKDVEFIFVDDHSPDDSIAVLKKVMTEYPERRIQIVTHAYNKGVSASRNDGLRLAKGEFVCTCDSDDWLELNALETLLRCAEENNADVVNYCFRMIYTDHSEIPEIIEWTDNKEESLKKYITTPWTTLSGLFSRRDVYTTNNIWSREDISYCEDFHLAVRLLFFASKVVSLNKVLYNYNQLNTSSIMHSLNSKTMHDEQVAYMDIIGLFKENGVYEAYKREMGWRILKATQEFVLDTSTYTQFLTLHPDSHNYILSCPYINTKLKIMMWCLTHHMAFISKGILALRKIKERLTA